MAFHYIDPAEMYLYEYLMYNLSVFPPDSDAANVVLPEKIASDQLWVPDFDNL